MTYRTSKRHLETLIAALKAPTGRASPSSFATQCASLVKDGWASMVAIEDVLFAANSRLSQYEAASVDDLLAMFELRPRGISRRPGARSSGVMVHDAISIDDLAFMLIELESLGFDLDSQTLLDACLPRVKTLPYVTSSQLELLWARGRRHRRPPITITIDVAGVTHYRTAETWKAPNGYRFRTFLGVDGELAGLRVQSPRYRKPKDPVRTICPECGVEYLKGDFDSGVGHRRMHKERMHFLDPQLLPAWQQALTSEATPELVTYRSAKWKHDEMYGRALMFKRERHIDFVQWDSAAQNARGHLLSNDKGVIVGACSFYYHVDPDDLELPHWGLQWVWIAPRYRRSGMLAQRWAGFRKLYGDFVVERPLSEAMQSFLAKHGELP